MLLTTAVLPSERILARTPGRWTEEGRDDKWYVCDGAWTVDGTWAESKTNVGTWAGSNVDCGGFVDNCASED